MADVEGFDSRIEDILRDIKRDTDKKGESEVIGTFQELSSLGGYLGLYEQLSTPSKDELIEALESLGVRTADEESVYDFVLIREGSARGFIRSKDGSWIDQDVTEVPDGYVSGGYSEYSKLASFLGIYDRYGLEQPTAHQLRQALGNYGVQDGPSDGPDYLTPLYGTDGEEYMVGVNTGDVTTAFPIDDAGY